jgi:hypothetical protein
MAPFIAPFPKKHALLLTTIHRLMGTLLKAEALKKKVNPIKLIVRTNHVQLNNIKKMIYKKIVPKALGAKRTVKKKNRFVSLHISFTQTSTP